MAEPSVSVEGGARHLGLARDSVHRWIEPRGLAACRLGRLGKFRIFEIDDLVLAAGAGFADAQEAGRKPG